MTNTILQKLVGEGLPPEHIWVKSDQRPRSIFKNVRMYYRKLVVHPMRRHRTHYLTQQLQSQGCDIIGITGSAGKTTTKEMLAAILSQKFKAVWSKGNIDPVYNIPETVLHTPNDTEKLILEMGIEFPGELDFYTWLARPNIGVMTTVDWTHTEFLGDVEGVLREKQKLITSLSKDGYAILNYDDERVRSIAKKTKAKVLFFGTSSKCDVQYGDVTLTKDFNTEFTLHYKKDSVKVKLPLLGYHFASLASAAAAVGIVCEMSLSEIKNGLESMTNEPHRMQPTRLKNDVILLDDTYNANPFATKEALKILKRVANKRRKVFVLGEMKELGGYSDKGHSDIGKSAIEAGVSVLITIGELTRHTITSAVKKGLAQENTYFASDKDVLLREIKKRIKSGDVILVKGSRSMGLEEIVDELK